MTGNGQEGKINWFSYWALHTYTESICMKAVLMSVNFLSSVPENRLQSFWEPLEELASLPVGCLEQAEAAFPPAQLGPSHLGSESSSKGFLQHQGSACPTSCPGVVL